MMKRGPNKSFGKLFFFAPIVFIAILVVYVLFTTAFNSSGTLVVEAQSSYHGSSHFISARASISTGASGSTPFNASVLQGSYKVTFQSLRGYHTPSPSFIPVSAGQVAYAVGVYTPIQVVVGITSTSFNMTHAAALHGITPIVWLNKDRTGVQLKSPIFNVVVPPGQNYTRIFQSPATFQVQILGSNATESVTVS